MRSSSGNDAEEGSGSSPLSVTVSWNNGNSIAISSPDEVLVGGHLDDTSGSWSAEEFWRGSLGVSGDKSELVLSDLLGGKREVLVGSGNDSLGSGVEVELLISSSSSVSQANSSVSLDVDNLTVVGADLESSFSLPSPS